ncbi:helix-turn-helix transcriptional regulator [Paenibacillus sp. P96]|uniref:Helix-turn-helix transcriptional regulator n=1 Tax=Paenibacillus zeirhizosphaerae TaxID=2987519 RepID=A0ABT9FSB7_9BACL|nr:helix-turn-helix transcriptional regulator [Paenibacillus sp. P96]MDP4097606.1 helix-turn-helix transcriptional regulator [Paenibacillus sp. P96]
MLKVDRRQELAQFLRSRRERISPQHAGIMEGGRRRTPGLRRSEVAMLAGMSQDWYTYLEQGRDIQVSSEVLESLARVLQLNTNERKHLFLLAHRHFPVEEKSSEVRISATLQHFLDQMEIHPASVIDARLNIVGWNNAFRSVYGNYDELSERERNLVWITFTSDYFRQIKGEHWEEAALRCLAQFRAGYGRFVEDPWWSQQIAELSAISEEFKAMWQRQEVIYAPEGLKQLDHPVAGELTFHNLSFTANESPELQVVINMPFEGTDTAEKVRQLLATGNFA